MQVGALDVDLALVGGDVEADDARERRLAAGEGVPPAALRPLYLRAAEIRK